MGCSVGFKYAKNALAAGAPPGPHWGAHDAPLVPDLLVGWGGGPHLHPTPPPRRLDSRALIRCFDPRAPPAEAWCPR